MKATLRFTLPEENSDFRDAQNGGTLKYAIQDFDNWLRSLAKYGDGTEVLTPEAVRARLYEELKDSGWRDD